jgi:chromosome segregation ATPase
LRTTCRRAEGAEQGRARAEAQAQELQRALGEAEDRVLQVVERASLAEMRAMEVEGDLAATQERADLLESALGAAHDALALHKSGHEGVAVAEAQWRAKVAAAEQGHAEAMARLREAQEQTLALEAKYQVGGRGMRGQNCRHRWSQVCNAFRHHLQWRQVSNGK